MKILLSAAEIQMDPNLKYKYTMAINIFDDVNILLGLKNKNTLRPRPKNLNQPNFDKVRKLGWSVIPSWIYSLSPSSAHYVDVTPNKHVHKPASRK